MLSVERDTDSEVLYEPWRDFSRHRGSRLSRSIPARRSAGTAIARAWCTGGHDGDPYMQATLSVSAGDERHHVRSTKRSLRRPGRRVYEAIYVKVLALEELWRPRRRYDARCTDTVRPVASCQRYERVSAQTSALRAENCMVMCVGDIRRVLAGSDPPPVGVRESAANGCRTDEGEIMMRTIASPPRRHSCGHKHYVPRRLDPRRKRTGASHVGTNPATLASRPSSAHG